METLTTFRQNNPDLLRTLLIAAAAAAAGGVGGIVLSKALLAAKGAAVAHTALAAKSGGSSVMVGEAAKMTVARGASLSDKAVALWNALARNAMPLSTGVAGGGIGGGMASMQAMKRRVSDIRAVLNEQISQTEVAQSETVRLQSELAGAETQLRNLQSRLDTLSARRPSLQNPLMQIQGIGPVFAERFNAAGIYTLEDLAALTPEAVRDIIGATRGGAMSDPDAWIAAAKQLADLS